jgi:DNA-binding protein YbaB
MKIKRFNENNHIDDETFERLDDFKETLQSYITGTINDLSSALEEYTINVSSQIEVNGTVPTDQGEFEFVLTIKKIL